jgi:hypothetical protein
LSAFIASEKDRPAATARTVVGITGGMFSELCVLPLEPLLLLPLLLLLSLAVLYASELLSDDSLDIIYLSIFNRVYILGTPIPVLFVALL